MSGLFGFLEGFNQVRDREWDLSCGDRIVCDENHRVGELVYCTKCNAYWPIIGWRYFHGYYPAPSSD